MNKKIKKNIRSNWFYSLIEFSSIEIQRKLWFPNEDNLISSYVELMCSYFDDTLTEDHYFVVIDAGYITEDEYKIVKPFHETLLEYKKPSENLNDILRDPKWIKISQLANKCFTELKENILSKEDLDTIEDIESRLS